MDLGSARSIDQMLIEWCSDFVPKAYKIQYAADAPAPPAPDSSSWKTWYETDSANGFTIDGFGWEKWAVIKATATSGRYWRVWSSSLSGQHPEVPHPGTKVMREIELYSATEKPCTVTGIIANGGGMVDGPTKMPVYNSLVHLEGPVTATMITDTDGRYVFSQLPAGEYTVDADAFGFAPGMDTVTATAGQIVTKDVNLTPRSETGVYNGGMESAISEHAPPLGWRAWPDNADGLHYYQGTTGKTGWASFACNRLTGATGNNVAAMSITPDKWVPVSANKAYNIYFWCKADPGVFDGAYSAVWRDAAGGEIQRIIYPGWFTPYTSDWKAWLIARKATPPKNAVYLDIHILAGLPDNDPSKQLYADDVVIDEVSSPAYPSSNSIGEARTMTGKKVTIFTKAVTATSGGSVPNGCIYIEDADRSAGILVDTTQTTIPSDLAIGNLIDIVGTVGTNSSGEPVIVATSVIRPDQGDPHPVKPLGTNVRSASTESLTPGLLITLAGTWTYENGEYWLDDGSVSGKLKVNAPIAGLPNYSCFVQAIGIVGMGQDGTRILRIRSFSDVTIIR
jgi:hypothetical protein